MGSPNGGGSFSASILIQPGFDLRLAAIKAWGMQT
jgi:hypothetical protein